MTETLTAVAIILALLATGGALALTITPKHRPDDDTYIDPRPQPPDWVNDAHHRRPRRGTWREDCTS